MIDIITNRVKHPYNPTQNLKCSIDMIKIAYILNGKIWKIKKHFYGCLVAREIVTEHVLQRKVSFLILIPKRHLKNASFFYEIYSHKKKKKNIHFGFFLCNNVCSQKSNPVELVFHVK